ncbi:hypothetical protein Tco_0868951 [Tanacetum coccineum]
MPINIRSIGLKSQAVQMSVFGAAESNCVVELSVCKDGAVSVGTKIWTISEGLNLFFPTWRSIVDAEATPIKAPKANNAAVFSDPSVGVPDVPEPSALTAIAEGPIPPKTVEQKLARKNELKAKITLMLAILDEHLLKFHAYKDAKFLWEAIKNRLILRMIKLYASYVDDVMFSFFSNQSNAPQLDYEDLEQINADDLEEMDLKWQVAMLTMRGRSFCQECRALRNHGNRNKDDPRRQCSKWAHLLIILGFSWLFKMGSSSSNSEVHTCSKDCLKSYETLQKQYDQQREALNKSNLEIIGYQMGLESLEARIVVHEKNEAVYEEDIPFLKYDVQVKDISIKDLKNQLEEALKEKDDLKLKLENFEESSKNLTKMINS